MKTLFLGSYGFGNLGDELCLIETMETFPSDEYLVASTQPEWTAGCLDGDKSIHVFSDREEIKTHLPIDLVVIGGGALGVLPGLQHFLHWAADARCEVIIHNIGVGNLEGCDMSWLEDSTVKSVLRRLSEVTVRDHISEYCWNSLPSALPRADGRTLFPETRITPDYSLADQLLGEDRSRRFVGCSLTNQQELWMAMDRSPARCLAEWEAVVHDGRFPTVVPIVSVLHHLAGSENDAVGFRTFAEKMGMAGPHGSRFEMAGLEMLDPVWWRQNLTPRKLKGIIGRLDCLVTQRKHNLIHAIGSGIKVVGIHPWEDDSLARVFYTMRQYLPLGSRLVAL